MAETNRIGDTRLGIYQGGAYLIRDVWDDSGAFITCEYGVAAADGTVAWVECEEASFYGDLKPLVTVASLTDAA